MARNCRQYDCICAVLLDIAGTSGKTWRGATHATADLQYLGISPHDNFLCDVHSDVYVADCVCVSVRIFACQDAAGSTTDGKTRGDIFLYSFSDSNHDMQLFGIFDTILLHDFLFLYWRVLYLLDIGDRRTARTADAFSISACRYLCGGMRSQSFTCSSELSGECLSYIQRIPGKRSSG